MEKYVGKLIGGRKTRYLNHKYKQTIMDQIAHDIRRNNWLEIVRYCLPGLEGMSEKAWLDQDGVNRKKYYF